MSPRQATLLTVLVIVGTVAVGLPAVTAQETATETVATQNDSASGMGTQLTAFLQSNSAAANDTVENGMWKSAYNQSNETERAELVTDRTGSLERRLERLQERNATLEQRYENGTISEQAYVARQSRLTAEIAGLQTAINDTDTAAEQTGVNDAALERLKQNASKLSGQQVSSIARGIAGPPETAGPGEQGPPGDAGVNQSERGPPANTSERGVNQSQQGPPADAPGQQGNESDQGPPDDGPDDTENEAGESTQGSENEGEHGDDRGKGDRDSDESDSGGDTAGDSTGSDDGDSDGGDTSDSDNSSGSDDVDSSDDSSDGDNDDTNDSGSDGGQGNSGGQGGDGGSGQGNGNSGSQSASWMDRLT